MKKYQVLILLAALALAACGRAEGPPQTPAETLKQYVEAVRRSDVEKMKILLSKSSLEFIEQSAKRQNLTVDDILKKEASVEIKAAPETRNEKIEGETATLEVKNTNTGEFDMKLPFVREDGVWKIARDKYIESLMKKLTDDMNKPPSNLSVSNSNSAPNLNINNSTSDQNKP